MCNRCATPVAARRVLEGAGVPLGTRSPGDSLQESPGREPESGLKTAIHSSSPLQPPSGRYQTEAGVTPSVDRPAAQFVPQYTAWSAATGSFGSADCTATDTSPASRRGYNDVSNQNPVDSLREATMEFTRITADPRQLGGVPCIRRLRIPVATVVGMVAEGMTTDEILEAYPDLAEADVREALRFAAAAVRERELPLASTL